MSGSGSEGAVRYIETQGRALVRHMTVMARLNDHEGHEEHEEWSSMIFPVA